MYPTKQNTVLIRRVLLVAILLLLIGLVVRVIVTEKLVHSSGILTVTTPAPGTSLTVTSLDHSAAYIGSGTARVRLQPGSYLVGATVSGERAVKPVTIVTGKTTTITINPAKPTETAIQQESTGYINFDVLVNHGIDSQVETYLEQLFSDYAPNAKIVSVNPDSVSLQVPDPNGDSTDFTLTFSGTIDSVPFNATALYDPYDNTILTLTNPTTGAQLFAGSAPEQGD